MVLLLGILLYMIIMIIYMYQKETVIPIISCTKETDELLPYLLKDYFDANIDKSSVLE